jgi:hypothetical protein
VDAFKNVLVMGVLLAVAGGVYIAITSNPPGQQPAATVQGPQVEMGKAGNLTNAPAFGMPKGAPAPEPDLKSPMAPGIESPRRLSPPGSPKPLDVSFDRKGSPSRLPVPQDLPQADSPDAPVPGQADDAANPVRNTGFTLNPFRGIKPASQQAGAQAGNPAADEQEVRDAFSLFIDQAWADFRQGEMVKVHRVATRFYGTPTLSADEYRQLKSKLTPKEHTQLDELLGQVAGRVIYSPEHRLEPAYVVREGDTLPQIADRYSVPWELLAKINSIEDPMRLAPGQQLKVFRGPFDAMIDLERNELTLMLQEKYAGRFAIGTGRDRPPVEGTYAVQRKFTDPSLYDSNRPAMFDYSHDPFGPQYLALSGNLVIHGAREAEYIGHDTGPGSICLNPSHLGHLYDILSVGSQVVVRR